MLLQFCEDPQQQHQNYGINVIRYLQETKEQKQSFILMQIGIRMSLIEFIGTENSQESRKQKVATSSAEAEYIVLTEPAKEAGYFNFFFAELRLKNENVPIKLFSDSQRAQGMAKFRGHHSGAQTYTLQI